MSGILAGICVVALSACGETSVGDCPTDSAMTQTQGKAIVSSRCLSCHNSGLTGAARQDAPEDLNFDKLDVVREWAGEMYGEAEEGEMPPGAPMAAAEVELMRVWLACGAVEAP